MLTLIVSIRGSHLDALPADVVKEALVYLNKNFKDVPVAVCYETDPKCFDLTKQIDKIKEKIDHSRSRYRDRHYTIDEKNHDLSIFWLLKAIRLYVTPLVASDMLGISEIALGDPTAEAKKAERENAMTTALVKAASNPQGGIIFDFGGISHTTGIEKRLAENSLFKASTSKPEVKFCCVYSEKGRDYIPINFRMMQFTGISQTEYPLGLQFLSSELMNGDNGVIQNLTESLKSFCEKYRLALKKDNPVQQNSFLPSFEGQADKEIRIRNALMQCKIIKDGDTLPTPELAIRRAAAAGKIDTIRALLKDIPGLDINTASTDSGKTALHFAVINEKTNTVRFLITECKAKTDIPDNSKPTGKTAVDYAKESKNESIGALFVETAKFSQ